VFKVTCFGTNVKSEESVIEFVSVCGPGGRALASLTTLFVVICLLLFAVVVV